MGIELTIDLRRLPYAWSSLTKDEQQDLLNSSPLVAPLVSPLTWLHEWTKTWDEHDTATPHKPFPQYDYFAELARLWTDERVLFVAKSRTMMATWFFAAMALHHVMTHQPASCIFWCPDQDRAEKCIDYCKVLYSQQDKRLQALYPLPRRKRTVEDLAVYRFEFAGGGWLEALPGKNPDKIRSEHPTIVMMDEAAHNPNGGEAYGNAISTRPQKLVAVSSAAPGWFFDLADSATFVGQPVRGLTLKKIPDGKPAAGTTVAWLHYTADPTMTPERVAELKRGYPDQSIWDREMEIDPRARSGQKVFPEWNAGLHCVAARLPLAAQYWTTYLACDPHPRRAHAFVWLCVNKYGEMVVPWSWWPEEDNRLREARGKSRFLIREYAEGLRDVDEAKLFPPVLRRWMDSAGKNFDADQEHNFFDAYQLEGIYFQPAKKNREYAGYSLISRALVPQKIVCAEGEVSRPLLTIMRGCGHNDILAGQIERLRFREYRGIVVDKDAPDEPEGKDRHLVDCLSYILLEMPRFVAPHGPRRSTFVPANPATGY